jgi:2-desacetyl-2-hydroxyethyl bacteriochlorophyllide A dehydrogenase
METRSTMQALQLQGINQLVQVTVAIPIPKADEVLIRTRAATICTSDLHDLKSNAFGIKYPIIIGHEGAGEVVECGADVTHLHPGIRVASHPVVPCGKCTECLRGFDHLCANMGHLGIDRQGCFAEYFTQRADRLRVLPDTVSFEVGALLEPVCVCLQAIARAGDVKGKKVLIAGDGPFGNIIAQLANRSGASKVLVSGRTPFRLQQIPDVEILTEIPVQDVDITILAVSSKEAVKDCVAALRPRGRLVIFSTIQEPVPIDLFSLHVKELEIVGACNDENELDESLAFLKAQSSALEKIVTHRIAFQNWKEAFHLAGEKHDQTLKVALTF